MLPLAAVRILGQDGAQRKSLYVTAGHVPLARPWSKALRGRLSGTWDLCTLDKLRFEEYK
jgi:hypothetical protein